MRKLLIAVCILGLAGPAFANEPLILGAEDGKAEAEKPKAPVKGSRNDPDRIICTREHVVGSNRPQKVCLSVAERQRRKDAADYALDPSRRTPDNEGSIRAQQAQEGGG